MEIHEKLETRLSVEVETPAHGINSSRQIKAVKRRCYSPISHFVEIN